MQTPDVVVLVPGFLGCLVDELRKKSPPTTTYTVIEAVRAPTVREKPGSDSEGPR